MFLEFKNSCNGEKQVILDDRCLTLHSEKLTFFLAFETCRKVNGTLFVVNKPLAENLNLTKLLESISRRFWIGLSNSWFVWKGSGNLKDFIYFRDAQLDISMKQVKSLSTKHGVDHNQVEQVSA